MMTSYLSGRFPESNGGRGRALDPIELTPSANANGAAALGQASRPLQSLCFVLNDSASITGTPEGLCDYLESTAPDVIVLVYDGSSPASLARVATYWKPALDAAAGESPPPPGWPYTPIMLVGAKEDAFNPDDARGWGAAYTSVVKAMRATDAALVAAASAATPEGAALTAELEEASVVPEGTPASVSREEALQALQLCWPALQAMVRPLLWRLCGWMEPWSRSRSAAQ